MADLAHHGPAWVCIRMHRRASEATGRMCGECTTHVPLCGSAFPSCQKQASDCQEIPLQRAMWLKIGPLKPWPELLPARKSGSTRSTATRSAAVFRPSRHVMTAEELDSFQCSVTPLKGLSVGRASGACPQSASRRQLLSHIDDDDAMSCRCIVMPSYPGNVGCNYCCMPWHAFELRDAVGHYLRHDTERSDPPPPLELVGSF
jgi:hypothetical protein